MVADFSVLKDILVCTIDKRWDHGFLLYEDDLLGRDAMQMFGPRHKTVLLDVVPTVENLVVKAAEAISRELHHREITGFDLVHVRLFETPNCWADWSAK